MLKAKLDRFSVPQLKQAVAWPALTTPKHTFSPSLLFPMPLPVTTGMSSLLSLLACMCLRNGTVTGGKPGGQWHCCEKQTCVKISGVGLGLYLGKMWGKWETFNFLWDLGQWCQARILGLLTSSALFIILNIICFWLFGNFISCTPITFTSQSS